MKPRRVRAGQPPPPTPPSASIWTYSAGTWYPVPMMVLQSVLTSAGLVVAILFGVWRMMEALRKENREAHSALGMRIDRVEERLDRVAHDVAFLAGRQAERDQQT